MERNGQAQRVTKLGLWINLLLTAFKYFAGFWGRSGAMVADATHSLSDLITDVVVLLGLSVSGKPADISHPYGHGKVEALLAAVCGISLVLAGGGIFWSGADRVIEVLRGEEIEEPGMLPLIAAFLSVTVKEWLYRYTIVWGRNLDSSALIAKAWDHRSDALSSVGTLVGIGGAIFLGERWRVLDPIAAVIVSFFILRVALSIMRDSLDELIETALPDELEGKLRTLILSVAGVLAYHKLKTRRIGSAIAVDVHIQMDGDLSLTDAHDISRQVELKLWETFGRGTHISLHMEPLGKPGTEHK